MALKRRRTDLLSGVKGIIYCNISIIRSTSGTDFYYYFFLLSVPDEDLMIETKKNIFVEQLIQCAVI